MGIIELLAGGLLGKELLARELLAIELTATALLAIELLISALLLEDIAVATELEATTPPPQPLTRDASKTMEGTTFIVVKFIFIMNYLGLL